MRQENACCYEYVDERGVDVDLWRRMSLFEGHVDMMVVSDVWTSWDNMRESRRYVLCRTLCRHGIMLQCAALDVDVE